MALGAQIKLKYNIGSQHTKHFVNLLSPRSIFLRNDLKISGLYCFRIISRMCPAETMDGS